MTVVVVVVGLADGVVYGNFTWGEGGPTSM